MERTLIIAEAGVNHNGDIEIAKQLIKAAKECGADIVKFQTARLESLVSADAPMADYQKTNTGEVQSQKEMLKKLLLPFEAFVELSDYCRQLDIGFLSTPFDIESIAFLSNLQNVWKIPSGEITNYPYLVQIGKTKQQVILSTGMSSLDEIRQAVDVLRKNGTTDLILLHCTTEYPTPIEQVNLNAMHTLKTEFGCPVGYSDHTQGIVASLAAVAMGATVIEKHFTLDKTMVGPDHKASLEPNELKALVDGIRAIEQAGGSFEKQVVPCEEKNRSVARKSIVAARAIAKGETFTEENLTTKRPGNGLSPMLWNTVLGQKATRNFSEDELIEL